MADEIKYIPMIVGMFDGNSFKKIKRAKIDGISCRNVLTAVWFELLNLAAKCNANGSLIGTNSIPFNTYEDIATQLDRDEKEVKLCLNFFEEEKMIEFVDGIYKIKNFAKYQNIDILSQIRENNRLRQAKCREHKKQTLLSYPHNEVSRDSHMTECDCHSDCHTQNKEKVKQKETNTLLAKDIKEKIINACAYAQGTGRFDKSIELIIKAMTCAYQNEKIETYAGKQRDVDYWANILDNPSLPKILAKTVNSLMIHQPERDEIRYTLSIIASESDILMEIRE